MTTATAVRTQRKRPPAWLLVLVVVCSNVFGNFLMSWGLKHRGGELGGSALEFILVLFNPWVASGVGLLILWMLSRMVFLSWADLSYVLPVTSFGYVLNAILGRVFLGEQISPARWAGTLLIVGGTMLVSRTVMRTSDSKQEAA